MHAFIIRPFGQKRGVDFDAVERDLIAPALSRLGITGRTTADITRAGSIRADMFHLLLTADLVVADISIHNANVFYELGVRHALRDKRTFMIRAELDEVPFDLRTDRYLAYDPAQPVRALDALIDGLAATRREEAVDSPVYSLVSGLRAPDPATFVVVPPDFREEVAIACAARQGGDLRFLAAELDGLSWRREGRRVVGEAQFELKDLTCAAETWEAIRADLPGDVGANLRLGTIYQRLGDLVRSDLSVGRVVSLRTVAAEQLAEAHALLGSNEKTRWLADWSGLDPEMRQAEALRSPHLLQALEAYRRGFEAEPHHYYSGLNALALVTVLTELAAAHPEVWQERFGDEEEARFRLRSFADLRAQLAGAVEFALIAQEQRLAREGTSDPWLKVSGADLAFLRGRGSVRQQYREALRTLGPFAAGAVRRQFDLFQQLSLLPASVSAAAPVLETLAQRSEPRPRVRVLLFTGHRIDDPDRATPRFPASQEGAARAAIEESVSATCGGDVGNVVAIAGGASGGDLLFLEVCETLGIARHLYLIMPRDPYVRDSVAPSGGGWVARFDHQLATSTCRVYQQSDVLPRWLQGKPDYSIWERSNTWMLHNALWRGGSDTTLIALWDGAGGDGPGGTRHMVDTARARGARTIVIDTHQLFGQ
jgi:hypothetical protein